MPSERGGLVGKWLVVMVAAVGCNNFGAGTSGGNDAHVAADAGAGGASKGGAGGSASLGGTGGANGIADAGGGGGQVGNTDAAPTADTADSTDVAPTPDGAASADATAVTTAVDANPASITDATSSVDTAGGTDAAARDQNQTDAMTDVPVDQPAKPAPVCTGSTKRCSGLQPQTCDASGAWQNTGAVCPNLCDNATGTCAGVCTPSTRKCNGMQPQTCDAKGAWQSTGTACSGCTTCSATSGTCVNAANSTSCNDGNACTQADSCQAGTCVGTTITCPAPAACHVTGTCTNGTCSTPPAADGTSDTKCPTSFQHCVAGACVQCLNDTHCSGSTPSCDVASHKCVCRKPSPGNLVVNGGFDKDLSGWTEDGDFFTWSNEDADNCPGSGSAYAPRSDLDPTQRIPITGGKTYYFGMRLQLPATTTPSCTILLSTAARCEGTGRQLAGDFTIGPTSEEAGVAQGWFAYSTAIQTPVDASCAVLYCISVPRVDQLYFNADDHRF